MYYSVKVAVTTEDDKGKSKTTKQAHLVQADSAEEATIRANALFSSLQDFEVTDINKTSFLEVHLQAKNESE